MFIYSQYKHKRGREGKGREEDRKKTKENVALYCVFLLLKMSVEVAIELLNTHTDKYTKKTEM